MARLLIQVHNESEQEIELSSNGAYTIGRNPSCRIQLLDKAVSKEHAILTCERNVFSLKDLGSINGSYVRGQRVEGAVTLEDGDEIGIGSARMRFSTSPDRALGGVSTPLLHVALAGELVAGRAKMRVEQRYRNDGPNAIEAIYTFPLPSTATVVGYSITCGDRRIDGEVRERDEAFAAYDAAISAGHGAALLETERRDVFTCNVGNVLPGEEVAVEITYVQRLIGDEGRVRVTIPTLVAPRYMPGQAQGDRTAHGTAAPTDQVPDADRISPPIGNVTYRASLDLVARFGDGTSVRSPSHAIATRVEAGALHLSFDAGGAAEVASVPLDRDVVLLFDIEPDNRAVVVGAHRTSGARGYLSATIVPDLFEGKAVGTPLDVVFLLDRSGSMQGTSIHEARRALSLCLRALREGDRFSILAFDNVVEAFSPGLVPFTQASLQEADAFLDRLNARGGTELLGPLMSAVGLAPSGVVVVLTDGQVGNEAAIEAAVLASRQRARIYGFAIGMNASDALLDALARKSGGALETIYPGEAIDDKVIGAFARALASRVTGVRVVIRGVEGSQGADDVDEIVPAPLPDLVDGDPWSLFARYGGSGPAVMEISGLRGDAPYRLEVPIELPAIADDPIVAQLWAAERVRDLESGTHDARRAELRKKQIVQLAIEHKIASSHTSFVAIERRVGDRLAVGTPETRVVAVNAPAGWQGGVGRRVMASTARGRGSVMVGGLPPPMAPPPQSMAYGGGRITGYAGAPRPPVQSPPIAAGASPMDDVAFSRGVSAGAEPPPRQQPAPATRSAPATPTHPIAELFARQLASGLWGDPNETSPDPLIDATLDALLQLLLLGVRSTSDEAQRYAAQLGKVAEALVGITPKGVDRFKAARVLEVALDVVGSPRARRALEAALVMARATP